MTIWISREVPLFNFESLDILCSWIGNPSEKIWPFKFLESFRCSNQNVSIYFEPESQVRVKSYENLKFSRFFHVQFQATWYVMCPNQSSDWKVMTIWISREVPLFIFERLDIFWTRIASLWEKLWPFKFLESFRCSISSVSIYYAPELDIRVKSYYHLNFSRYFLVLFRASWYIMFLNRSSDWKVMTIWISWEVPLFNFERLDILCSWIGHPSEKILPFEFLESFRWSISNFLIYDVPELDIPVKSYDHLNFLRASVVQFRASRYIMSANRTSQWKVMTI